MNYHGRLELVMWKMATGTTERGELGIFPDLGWEFTPEDEETLCPSVPFGGESSGTFLLCTQDELDRIYITL
jgi:hypothetical protein